MGKTFLNWWWCTLIWELVGWSEVFCSGLAHTHTYIQKNLTLKLIVDFSVDYVFFCFPGQCSARSRLYVKRSQKVCLRKSTLHFFVHSFFSALLSEIIKFRNFHFKIHTLDQVKFCCVFLFSFLTWIGVYRLNTHFKLFSMLKKSKTSSSRTRKKEKKRM